MSDKQECLHISDKTQHEFVSDHHILELERFGIVQCGIAHCRELFTIHRTNMYKHMLLYTVKGQGWLKGKDTDIKLEAGSLAIVPAGFENRFGIEQEEWQIAWVFLSPDWEWNGLIADKIDYRLSSTAEAIYAAVLMLLRARMLPIELSGKVIESTIQQLDWLVNARLDDEINSKQVRLRRVFDVVQRQLHKEWDVEQVSELFPCSPPHFHRLCKQYYGHSPKVHITRMRMEYASRLLLSTDWAVQHIGEMVGYPIAANFCARFKAWSGKTPREHRTNPTALDS
ncbi:AraC family transcriptional regulator [Vibrio sp. LaRot3]|uniref:AraC family transcriptional regulator n=1 Tax=Vibrio sp. LaRot3 TaxID=2998829 RepID=UPI0022CDFA9E|nr:AraC family transcriptional regulator [Vibrio sp. LaRot3]MDA0148461.1 AraC family transcriptional regulator [Vibrio sp. LaRot3]